jgi:hypothetical protein
MYSIVLRAHLNTGHGGREKMLKEVNKKYANVTRDVLNLFKEINCLSLFNQFFNVTTLHVVLLKSEKRNMFFSIEYLYMSLIRAHTVLKLQEKKTHLLL